VILDLNKRNLTYEQLSKNIIDYMVKELKNIKYWSNPEYEQWVQNITKMMINSKSRRKYLAYFDGSAKPNPGIMSIGGFIQGPDKRRIYKYSINKGEGTNNVAEYLSLIHVLEEAKKRGIQRLLVRGDSQLIINQANGIWKAREQKMKDLYSQVVKARKDIPTCDIMWYPRSENKEADKLANRAHKK